MYEVVRHTAKRLSYEGKFETFKDALKDFVEKAAETLQTGRDEAVYLEVPESESYNGLTLFPHYIQSFYVLESTDTIYVIYYDSDSKRYNLFTGFNKLLNYDYDLMTVVEGVLPF